MQFLQNNRNCVLGFTQATLLLLMAIVPNANAGLFGLFGENWKEEVLLHDGTKIIVNRSQTHGGNHEIGQSAPIKEWHIAYTLPNSTKEIIWTSKDWVSFDTNGSSLGLLAFDIVDSVPYVVTITGSCTDYNKWGRPNPPYVIFKYDGNIWHRISLTELPFEIKEANVVNDTGDYEKELIKHNGAITSDEIKKINGYYRPEVIYQKIFVREPIKNEVTNCSKFE